MRRYVRRRIDALGHCYEQQLLADPHLSGGSVAVVIAKLELPAGGVTQVAYVLVYAPPAR